MKKNDIIKWEEGKMFLEPKKTYSMTGKELVDMGRTIDSDGYLIANTLTYTVQIGMPWAVHQYHPPQTEPPMTITARTPFSKVQARYPDAMRGEFITDKPMTAKRALREVYGKGKDSLSQARCLYERTTPVKGGYKNVYIFSEAAAQCPNCLNKGTFSETNVWCDDCVAEAFEKEEKELEDGAAK